jgi:hypothetical protein
MRYGVCGAFGGDKNSFRCVTMDAFVKMSEKDPKTALCRGGQGSMGGVCGETVALCARAPA